MTDHICTVCRTRFVAKKPQHLLGAALVVAAIIAIVALNILGWFIAALCAFPAFRALSGRTACPACSATTTVPTDTPAGRELIAKGSSTVVPDDLKGIPRGKVSDPL